MSLEPARLNFSFWKGSTFQKRLTYKQGGDISEPIDLSGYSAELIITDSTGSVLLTLSTSDAGGITLGGAAGTLDLLIADDVTADVPWRSAIYTLSITSASSIKDCLLFGNFIAKGL